MLCVRAEVACVSENLVGLWAFVFHWWWEGLFVPAATWRFAVDMRRITADRAISSNFVGCKPISPIVPGGGISKNALVRLKLQENGYPRQAKPLTIQVIPHRL